jgi:N-acetylated-alpha-linked acidic dipeptidase
LKKRAFLLLVAASILAVAGAELWSARRRGGFIGRARGQVAKLVDAKRIGEGTAAFAAVPHRAGTSSNANVAGLVGERLRAAGLKVWNTPYEVELYEPLAARLALVEKGGPKEYDLSEADSGDPATLAYTPDADLTAGVVYGNFGARADYELLRRKGVSLGGKLVLVRAQGICRGMKAEIAAEVGAVGLILFPEPRDQGFAKPAWPDGPNTPRTAIQRGTMLRYYLYPGDPVSAGEKGVDTRPHVPALGVSQAVAIDLLSRMRGEAAPEEWRGWLKAPYVLAAEGPRVRLTLKGQLVRKTIRNVYALLPGQNPDARSVMVGSHYDAWEQGAVDPGSGTAVVVEAAEALESLSRGWWRPERTILFAFFDGEEAGMFGSTKWVEQALRDRFEGLAAYLNVDSAVRANDFVGNVSPGLAGPLDRVLATVDDPDSGRPIAESRGTFQLPGFSSDVSPFLGLAGTPVAEIGFGRWYPVYHTRADTVEWIRRFGDPGFVRAAILARVLALYAGALASERVMPYRFAELSAYTRVALRKMEGGRTRGDEWRPYLGDLPRALDQFEAVARRWDGEARRLATISESRARKANALVESAMASFGPPPGAAKPLPFGRASVLLGPSAEEGCVAEPLAPLAQAVRVRDFTAIRAEAGRLSQAFNAARERLLAAEWIAIGRGEAVPQRGR